MSSLPQEVLSKLDSEEDLLAVIMDQVSTSTNISSSVPAPSISSVPTSSISSVPVPSVSSVPASSISSIPAPFISSVMAPSVSSVPTPSVSSVPAHFQCPSALCFQCEQVLFVYVFTIIPPRLTDPRNFITILLVTQEPEQMTLLFWSAACGVSWPSHSRPAIAASARHFQICSPLIFWLLVSLLTLCSPSPFYALSHV